MSRRTIPPDTRRSSRKLRVLVVSHGHPAITRGGAEIAAYALFSALQREKGYDAWFLGCRPAPDGARLGVVFSQPFNEREFVYHPAEFDWFKFANRDPRFPSAFAALLGEIKPDVVHFHHFAFFGLEAFRIVKQVLPKARVVLTVHEYLLICNAYGQMVTKQDQKLCTAATFDACHRCFPQHSTADFFLRRHYAEMFLPFVDVLVAPSQFLASRLVAWGIEAARLRVIENVIEAPECRPAPPDTSPEKPLIVGFFGQISRLKGIGVLLQAAALQAESSARISFEIYGEYRAQPPEFQAEFLEQLAAAGPNVRYHGSYRPEQVDGLMRGVTVVVTPSIWWENSPVVIQEAFRNKRPVICSGIGGMAEKVRDGIDGWHVTVGNAVALAALLTDLAHNRERIGDVAKTMQGAAEPSAAVRAHCALYRETDTSAERCEIASVSADFSHRAQAT